MYGEPFELTSYYDRKLTEEDIAAADEELRQHMLSVYHELENTVKKKGK